MNSDVAPFRLILPSSPKVLPLARTFVEHVCGMLATEHCVIEALQIATHEAIQNVIRHAHRNCDNVLMEIQIMPIEDGIEVSLFDEGEPFDMATVPHLDPGELRIGGRGVFMIRRLVDEISSHPRIPRGNVLRLVKHFRPVSRRHPA